MSGSGQTGDEVEHDPLGAAEVFRFVVNDDDSHRRKGRQRATILQYGVQVRNWRSSLGQRRFLWQIPSPDC